MSRTAHNSTLLAPELPILQLQIFKNFGPLTQPVNHTNKPHMNHNTSTTPIIMPASLRMATLFPDAAILPNRLADPFKEPLMEEKVSVWRMRRQHEIRCTQNASEEPRQGGGERARGIPYYQ